MEVELFTFRLGHLCLYCTVYLDNAAVIQFLNCLNHLLVEYPIPPKTNGLLFNYIISESSIPTYKGQLDHFCLF